MILQFLTVWGCLSLVFLFPALEASDALSELRRKDPMYKKVAVSVWAFFMALAILPYLIICGVFYGISVIGKKGLVSFLKLFSKKSMLKFKKVS